MLKSIKSVNIGGKTVLCRVDYNVPLEGGKIQDETRILRSLPTINYLLKNNAKIILCSHLGRPGGKPDPKLSLKPISKRLSELIDEQVGFSEEVVGEAAKNVISKLGNEFNILMLENTRFHPGEKSNDVEFSRRLAEPADLFVSDAFGAVHRTHASTRGVTRFIPGYAGFLVMEEYNKITEAVNNPQSPALAIFGGAKISTKLDVLHNFIDKVDTIALGGGMANTFIKAQGYDIADSLVEDKMLDTAKQILEKVENTDIELLIPTDVRIAKSFDEPLLEYNVAKVVNIEDIPKGTMILDIGPKSEAKIAEAIIKAKTITWNGPLGVFEKELYREGTMIVAKEILQQKKQTIVGGGETAYAINMASDGNIPDEIHVSTGGGASLELMSGKDLPGLTCLTGKVEGQ